MKLFLAFVSVFCCLAAEPLGPPAPELVSITRGKNHAELTWDWAGRERDVDAFQVNRRFTNGVIDQAFTVGVQKVKVSAGPRPGTIRCQWIAKKLEPVPYVFSVMVFTEDGTSLESNALPITP